MTRTLHVLLLVVLGALAVPGAGWAQDHEAREAQLRAAVQAAELASSDGEQVAALVVLAAYLDERERPLDAAAQWKKAHALSGDVAYAEGRARALLKFAEGTLNTGTLGAAIKAAFADARIALESAREAGSRGPQNGIGLARCAAATGDPDGQVRLLERTLSEHPKDPAATRALGFALLVAKRYKEAVPVLKGLSDEKPGEMILAEAWAAAARLAGDETGALAAATRAVEIDPSRSNAWIAVWRIYATGKRFGELADRLVALAERFPKSAVGAHYAGFACSSASRVDLALEWLAGAVKLDPENVAARLQSARLLISQKQDKDKAVELYRQVLALRPQDNRAVSALLLLAQRTEEAGTPELAEPLFRMIAEARPDEATSLANHALALRWSGRYAEAVAGYRKAVRLDEWDPQIHNDLGLLYLVLGRDEEAAAAFRAAHEADDAHNDGLENLGFMARERGDAVDAEKWFLLAWGAAIKRGEDGARHRRNLDDVRFPLPPIR